MTGRPLVRTTYPWKVVPVVQASLSKRGFAYTLDKRGLTIRWEDADLTKQMVQNGIAAWIAEDRYKRPL